MNDIHRFPSRAIPHGTAVFTFWSPTPNRYDTLFTPLATRQDRADVAQDFDEFLRDRDTYAFLVIRRDTLIYEQYFHGRKRQSIETTFSISKSLVSIATGIALDSGWIGSVRDPITRYLPELTARDPDFSAVTIEHLLTMTSGIRFNMGKTPWSDEARSYYSPDLRSVALSRELAHPPGTRFQYNPYSPIVLGLVLERASGRPLTVLLSEALWSRIGADAPASWSLDTEKHGFEKMESGFNATAIDLAKIGRLFLREGDWDGDRILRRDWVRASIEPDSAAGRARYGYFWWVQRGDGGEPNRYYAEGRFGQLIYVAPHRDLVIVRTGRTDGDVNWISVFERIVRRVDAVDQS
ncbi:MAG TPA: serine hydrolase [Longimicrobiales bacterium]|nr:serine hydrolase [Longimicrobiales bacterium]